jgi:hypothetical protein
VDGVTSAGADLEKSIAGMKEAAGKRFADWEAGEAAYTTEAVPARSQQRRGEARGLFDASVAAAEEMDRQGKGFMAFLVDIRMLLSNDLTPKGIEGTKDLVQNARASNGRLHQLTQPTVTALKAAADSLSTQ